MSAVPRVLVVPDSFKGSLGSAAVAAIVADALREAATVEVREIAVADGGEGTVDAFLAALGGERVEVEVAGPYGHPIPARYGVLPDGTAVIEMAAAGLPLVGEDRRVGRATTFGVGELILHAARGGARRIVIGLGGSASNDAGCGAAAAVGVNFHEADGLRFVPVGDTLHLLDRIDPAGLDSAVRDATIVAICDIDNPLCGPRGAAAVFGPQKGATPGQVALLDAGLARVADVIARDLAADVRDLPGAGAAGGMGAGLVAFLGAELRAGIDVVLDVVGFDDLLATADLVITGEGSFDAQSLDGKVVSGLARRCRTAGVPLVVLAGRVAPEAVAAATDLGILDVVQTTPEGQSLPEALSGAEANPRAAVAAHARRWLDAEA